MKIINIKTQILLFIVFLGLSSCSKSWLEASPKGTNLESNYYQNPEQAFNGLVAMYQPTAYETLGGDYTSRFAVLSLASDDCYAGGGSNTDQPNWQAWSDFSKLTSAQGPSAMFWNKNYIGIYRTNVLLSKLDQVPGLDSVTKHRYIAEAKFLRAYFYFDLIRLFKSIPMFTTPIELSDAFNQTQVDRKIVFAQIEKDLNEARPDLPITVDVINEGGRVTQGAAIALLGKVILWQNDAARMQEAANLFEQVNTGSNPYGYKLLTNYGDIFKPDNKFNSESIFEIVHTSKALNTWSDWGSVSGNVGTQMIGARSYSGPLYEAGWGFAPVTTQLANALKGDPRYVYTVINVDSISKANPTITYEPSYQNTGYFIQKYAPLTQWKSSIGGDVALNYPNDYIEIRLADTYLMEAEAIVRGGGDQSKAQKYLDAVRARVGLPSVPPTLDNIYNERRLELATEGHRFFDLLRTGQAASVLSFKNFTPNKNEFLPIPLAELTNTKLIQDPAYK